MEDQVDELRQVCSEVLVSQESGVKYYLLKDLKLPAGCDPAATDALLCPTPRDGYPSRLFFAQRIASPKTQNWFNGSHRILDRNWFVYSWRLDVPGQRLAQMLANHLRAF